MRQLVLKLDQFLGWVVRPFEMAAIAILAIMLVANGVNILTRSLFDYSYEGVWPWTMTLFVWWVFIGFFPLYRQRKDVSIYVIVQAFPPKIQMGFGALVHALIAALAIMMLTIMEKFIGLQAGRIEIVGIPRFWLSIPLLLSLVFVALNAIVESLRILTGLAAFRAFGEVEV